MVAGMSQDEKLGQMLVMENSLAPTYTATQATMVKTFHPGGVVLFRTAMGTAQQVKALLNSGQQDSPIPMFVFLNQEGGLVDPLAKYFGPSSGPSVMGMAGAQAAEGAGGKTATELLSLGVNADIATNLAMRIDSGRFGFVTNSRSFGTTPDLVTSVGGAWLTSLQANGVVACEAEFPGDGVAATLAPYRALSASGQLQMIMSSVETIPALDPHLPAALSKAVITGVLRNALHFNGVAITDALYQANVIARFTFAQAAVLAIEAGNDMVSGVYSPAIMRGVVTALKAAIAAGKLAQAQVDASVTRILALKLRYTLIARPAGAVTAPIGAVTVPAMLTAATHALLRRRDDL
jgi:beta-N-acetylhexosaminidase